MAINMNSRSISSGDTLDPNQNELEVVEYNNIVQNGAKFKQELIGSQIVEDLTALIDISNLDSIVNFGSNVATEIAKVSDTVLQNMNIDKITEPNKILSLLNHIMDQFNIEEIKEDEKSGFFSKFLGNGKKKVENILSKYHSIGGEVDKIYLELKGYEKEINNSNQQLEKIFHTNVEYYHNLLEYIVAGEQGIKEIDAYILQLREEFKQTGDTSIHFEISNLDQASQLLAQRTEDLRIAENIAMQSIPMLKTMQFSNLNLVRKINSAFIITLPIFKQSLAQAIMLKRQNIQAQAMDALDKKTNDMLIRNAQNTVDQAKLTSQLASRSSVKIETLEETWQIIKDGIKETELIQKNAIKEREQNIKRLNDMKLDFQNTFNC
ncbi:MAG: hypothetical protein ATN31_04370 [Candidatus Epulonipiscioides saccharophilum]|nr:MAG: hypothetical protein ATN31_04370 [Epulopiscium sp. AS2M-Bin001]